MKLSEVARLMYELQEYCRRLNVKYTYTYLLECHKCHLHGKDCTIDSHKIPMDWGITQADIERLKKKEIETFTCKDCRHYQCRVSVFSMSKVCEKFELWQ